MNRLQDGKLAGYQRRGNRQDNGSNHNSGSGRDNGGGGAKRRNNRARRGKAQGQDQDDVSECSTDSSNLNLDSGTHPSIINIFLQMPLHLIKRTPF